MKRLNDVSLSRKYSNTACALDVGRLSRLHGPLAEEVPSAPAMDLGKLTNGLAFVQQGLADLDAKIRDELGLCGQLRSKAAAHRQRTQQLQGQIAEANEQLFQHQDEHDDLQALYSCLIEQTSHACARRQALQVSYY